MRMPPAFFLGFVLLGLGAPLSPGALAREIWSEIEHFQVLEGPEGIWVFAEVVRITDYTDELVPHLMSSTHPDRKVTSRWVFTIDRRAFSIIRLKRNRTLTIIPEGP